MAEKQPADALAAIRSHPDGITAADLAVVLGVPVATARQLAWELVLSDQATRAGGVYRPCIDDAWCHQSSLWTGYTEEL